MQQIECVYSYVYVICILACGNGDRNFSQPKLMENINFARHVMQARFIYM